MWGVIARRRARLSLREAVTMRAALSGLTAAMLLVTTEGASARMGCSAMAPWARAPALSPPARALVAAAARHFRFARAFEARAVQVCEIRVRIAESGWRIARDHGLPLWAIERVNLGRDLELLRYGEKLRVPALTRRIVRRCFTPIRPWAPRPDSGPPFWW
jgi:hypothetical protein